ATSTSSRTPRSSPGLLRAASFRDAPRGVSVIPTLAGGIHMRLSSWMCAIGTAALVAGCGSESGSQASAPTTGDEVNVELHDHPTREELAEVLGEQAAHIRDCGPGTGETVRVEIVFEGTSGQPIEINYPDDV